MTDAGNGDLWEQVPRFLKEVLVVIGACEAEAKQPARVLIHGQLEGMAVDGEVRGDDLKHPAEGCCGDVFRISFHITESVL